MLLLSATQNLELGEFGKDKMDKVELQYDTCKCLLLWRRAGLELIRTMFKLMHKIPHFNFGSILKYGINPYPANVENMVSS